MAESRSCNPELFQEIKQNVSMLQVAEYYGIQVNEKGLCLCPFHQDKKPSLKIYKNGKGFYCFSCGAGGDQIKFVSLYQAINNHEAAKVLAVAFGISVTGPVTYREKREAARRRRKRAETARFMKRAKMYLTAYRGLLCEAIREQNEHFWEGLGNVTYVEYLLDCLEQCPEQLYADKKAVKEIGKVEGRIADWYIRIKPDGSVSR